jgi:7-cyano-7-deazaguanine synthase in queuosine biosynthesis
MEVTELTKTMVANIPDRLADLLEIACYVHCADQFTRRDSAQMPALGRDWSRTFRFHLAVRDLRFWREPEVCRRLVDTLGFLSGDEFEFEFVETRRNSAPQDYLDFSGGGTAAGFTPEEIVLFSGGLDSFAGAVDALLRRKVRVVLVSHQSSTLVTSIQDKLVKELQVRAGRDQILHIGVRVNKGSEEAVEFTQRARSFLFATLGFVVAHMFDRRKITFFENGVVSINLPLAQHVLGTRATRTTHPRTLCGFSDLFSLVANCDARIENPFIWQTKADVIRKIADAGCGTLISETFSCTRVRAATRLGKKHCGVCSQCLDRRFGILAADCGRHEPDTGYAVELFRGARKPGPDTVMAEAYVLAAYRHARSTEQGFLSAHGQLFRTLKFLDMPFDEAARRLHDLHVRHGKAVLEVINQQLTVGDVIGSRLGLPDSCLLAMIQAPAIMSGYWDIDDASEPSASEKVAAQSFSVIPRPINFAINSDGTRVVFDAGVALSGRSAQIVRKLMSAYHDGLRAARGDDGFKFITAKSLAKSLGLDEQGFRQAIRRLRRSLTEQFEHRVGATIDDCDVVENRPGQGYRLNAHLVLVPALLKNQVSRTDVTPASANVTTSGKKLT